MKPKCPELGCQNSLKHGPKPGRMVRNGSFFRRSDSKIIKRYRCSKCGKTASSATRSALKWQKKRRLNAPIRELFCSGVSQRRAAQILKINPKTAINKFRVLARQAKAKHEQWMKSEFQIHPIYEIQFDDLETSEHTKCKPISVVIAVDPKNRKILGFKASRMPAKGRLVHLANRKYGPRPDCRSEGWSALFAELKPYASPQAIWRSDENPHYPWHLRGSHPEATHIRYKGGRGCIAGQGELKKLQFDPLFALNHTCAMLRANLNRLFRRTWCTTKKIEGLIDHLWIYLPYHNLKLTAELAHKF